MGLEAATFIGQLTTTNPATTDPKAQGDDHLRLIKTALQNTFPNLNAAVTFSSFGIAQLAEASASSAATAMGVPTLGGDNVLTGTLQLNFSDNGAGPQYRFDLRSASTTPAAADDLIEQRFIGVNDAVSPEDIAYAGQGGTIKDKTDGSEDGEWYAKTALAGVYAKRLLIGAGAYTPNVTSGDKGPDTINVKHVYKDGVEINPWTPVVRYSAKYLTNADIVATVPQDNTVPLTAETASVLLQAAVTTTATQKFKVYAKGVMASAASVRGVVCLFVGGVCVDVEMSANFAAEITTPFELYWEGVIGSATSTDVEVRAGSSNGSAVRFNGTLSGALFAQTMGVSLVVEVFEPA